MTRGGPQEGLPARRPTFGLRRVCFFLLVLFGTLSESLAHPSLLYPRAELALIRRRSLTEEVAAEACGMRPVTNDARTFNVPQWGVPAGTLPTDSGPDLQKADADAYSTLIYLDRYQAPNSHGALLLSHNTVFIRTRVTLTKPLVVSNSVGIEVAAGAVLTLAAQPVLPNRQVFSGAGAVRFLASPATPEFVVHPEWWGGSVFSNTLDTITRACAGAKCLVVLAKSYGLRRPWRITPNLLPWSGANAELHPEGTNKDGVVVGSGAYNPQRRIDLPRLQNFGRAVVVEDVSGLWLYAPNTKFVKAAVVLAPRAAIRNTQVEVYSVVSANNIFTIQPPAGRPLLQNVYLRSYMLVKTAPGTSNLNWFRGCPVLSNVTIESSEVNGNEPRSINTILRSDCPSGISGLNFRVTTMNYAHAKGWQVVAGAFNNLQAYVRLGQPIDNTGGTVSWQGSSNTLDWGSMMFLTKDAAQLSTSARPGTPPIVGNSHLVTLPAIEPWPANTVRTFYAYHIMMDGSGDGRTIAVGPHNQARLPAAARKPNPGIVVDGVTDEGNIVKHQLAIRLRNVSGRTLTQTDVSFTVPIQFRLLVGLPNVATQPTTRRW